MCTFPSFSYEANGGAGGTCDSLQEAVLEVNLRMTPPDGHCEEIPNAISNSVYNQQLLSLSGDDDFFPIEKSTGDLCAKRLFHNANERQRRRKLNALYSKLRSLLPVNGNAKKKLGIPAVTCQVVKYIPQLRTQIANLSRQRDELLALRKRKSSEEAAQDDVSPNFSMEFHQRFPNVTIISAVGSDLVLSIFAYRARLPFSAILLLLEEERLDVVNASTFVCNDKICHNLHLKVLAENCIFDTDDLCSKLRFLCE